MGNETDIDLMLRFGNGDEDAFRSLFMAYRKKIINYCYRFFFDQGMAEELSQEVFMKVYKAGSHYRPDAGFSTWIFKIATHVCLNELRKKRYRTRTVSLDSEEGKAAHEVVDPSPATLDVLEGKEQKKKIMTAIRDLPGKQRAAVLLREFHGFSYKEIATQLGQSESSVKTLIFRGRDTLKHVLHDERGEDL